MVIETRQLSKVYGEETVVDDVDLAVERGQIYGFLGLNGAGKSTTMKMVLGLTRPTRGSVSLFGTEFEKSREQSLSRIGSLIESPSYYPHLTGQENLELVRRLRGLPPESVAPVLDIVHPTEHPPT